MSSRPYASQSAISSPITTIEVVDFSTSLFDSVLRGDGARGLSAGCTCCCGLPPRRRSVVLIFALVRIKRFEEIPKETARLWPRPFVLILLIPGKLGVSFQAGSQACYQKNRRQNPTRTPHVTEHTGHSGTM